MKILLVYLPFCTPASPPYSITSLYSFLKCNCDNEIEVLDLNLEFHKLKFPEYQEYSQDIDGWDNYDEKTKEYNEFAKKVYSENNKKVIKEEKPELFNEMLKKISNKKPDIVAFSIVYSSQVFYAYSLLKDLKELGITTVVGGPSINEKLANFADETLNNEIELLEYIQDEKIDHDKLNFDYFPDFSIYNLNEYFTPHPVIPVKTSTTCFYKQCTFCSHYNKSKYYEFPLDTLKNTIVNSKQKYFFLVDDMIPTKRLLEIAEVVKPLNIKWSCQLRPTKDLTLSTLKKLRESGLTMIMWGVECASERVLKLIKKGTHKEEMEEVLEDSHNAGIKNITYILFGFPTETKDEFLETIEFLKKNDENIDLVSVSIFGLQKGTEIYNNPEKFGIKKIIEEERTILEPKITYEVESGQTQAEAARLRKRYKRTIEKINKYPKLMNYFREHMFCQI